MSQPAATILIVDDEPAGRDTLEALLATEQYHVISATNGFEAITAVMTHRPDVLLLDVMMPGMDGFEVCRRLRATPSVAEMPILLVTALDDRDSRLKGIEAGADDFLTKPIDRLELRARVRTITKLNRYRRLHAERERFEQLIRLSPDGIAMVDEQGRLLLVNPALERMLLASATELLGLPLLSFYSPDREPDGFAEFLQNLAQATPLVQLETCLQRSSGEPFPADVTTSRFVLGNTLVAQVIVRDITTRKQMEAHLLRAQRSETIGAIAGGVAHDLNNVLMPIIMVSDAQRAKCTDERLKSALETIAASAKRGAGIVRQILTFARGMDGHRELVQLAHIIAETLPLARQTFPKSVRIETNLAPDLHLITADATQLCQVLMNLCVNARDALPTGGTIRISAQNGNLHLSPCERWPGAQSGPCVILEVADTGTGIPAHLHERIFEPFFTTKPIGQGTGLGLSSVVNIVRNHAGYMELESTEGTGTRFRIYLPVGESQPTEAQS